MLSLLAGLDNRLCVFGRIEIEMYTPGYLSGKNFFLIHYFFFSEHNNLEIDFQFQITKEN